MTIVNKADIKACLEALRVEERYELVSTGNVAAYVRRKSRYDFVLIASNNWERSCWGSLAEILLDVEYFIEHNTLRPAKSPRW